MRGIALKTFSIFSMALASVAALPSGDVMAKDAMVTQTASTSVDDTVKAFVAILEKKGATVFATVDHAAGAEKVGLKLAPATLVIFGNPKIGTPLMQASPTMGLDLPLRVLFYEDADGKTQIVYPDMDGVASDHGIAHDSEALKKAKGAIAGLTGAVAK